MPGIVMLLSNAFRPDPRVLKEAESLRANGFEITILCWDRQAEFKPEEYLPSGVKIIRIQNTRSRYGIGIRQILRLPLFWISILHYLRKLRPKIIHCHDFDTLPAGLVFGWFFLIPVVYDAHEYYVELIKPRLKGILGRLFLNLITWLEKAGARKASAIVTVDQSLAAIYHKQNSKVIILGHYPISEMARVSNPVFSRSQLTMIYTGRLSIDRGLLCYRDLLMKLLEKGISARLVLAGAFVPESEKNIFFASAQEIAGVIEHLGWIPYEEISKIYHQADLGLAILLPEPRYVAATPVKLFEYMASGLPVIASNFPPISQVINEVKCGLLVDPRADIAPVAEIIESWYRNKTIPQAMGENGRQAILAKYNWENQVTNLITFYHSLEQVD
jgi:glycosyltransferase involved in cell wall biosynthesis